MKKWMFAIFGSALILGGCGQSDTQENSANNEEAPVAIDALLEVPEKAEAGEEVSLAVTVTQGEDAVEDANEVKFEIWKDGQEESSEMLEAEHSEKGKYIANKTFSEDGAYYVQSHVTARSMHTMPKKLIQIGNTEAGQHEHSHKEEGQEHDHEEADNEDGHSHEHGDVSMELIKPDHVHANQQTELAVHLEKEANPLSGARVRLEISGQTSNTEWVDMKEVAEGEYNGSHQFPSSGKYTVIIHVENDEGLHEHTETEVTAE